METKKYTRAELTAMKEKSDTALYTMTVAGVGIGFAPVMIDIAALMTAMGVGVVAIGNCYGYKLNKADAGELIKHFFRAAGMTYSFIFVGQKITTSILKSNPVSYIPTMIADAIMCGATAYAVGYTSQKYFHKQAEGAQATVDDIKRWMKDGKKEGQKISKQKAEEEAAKRKAS